MINAVMLGVIAGAGALPIPAEAFEAAIRADGKAVEANLRGFRAGFDAAQGGARLRSDPAKRHRAPAASLADLESEIARMPEAARAFMTEGVRRLAAYQDLAYARLYLDRLGPIRDADAKAGADGQLLAETARHLAVRMSYEDVIRVAQAKIDPARFAAHRRANGRQAGSAVRRHRIPQARCRGILLDPAAVAGAAAFSRSPNVMPGSAAPIGAWRSTPRRSPAFCASTSLPSCAASGRAPGASRKSSATSTTGSASSRAPRRCRPSLRSRSPNAPASSRATATPTSAAATIIGVIVSQVIEPALAGQIPLRQAADAIASARTAALLDPEGEALSKCLAAIVVAAGPRHRRRISDAERAAPRADYRPICAGASVAA